MHDSCDANEFKRLLKVLLLIYNLLDGGVGSGVQQEKLLFFTKICPSTSATHRPETYSFDLHNFKLLKLKLHPTDDIIVAKITHNVFICTAGTTDIVPIIPNFENFVLLN
jgi:hypothetical protein